eukprot:1146956-Pelagomonas_calceolata.AAC.1
MRGLYMLLQTENGDHVNMDIVETQQVVSTHRQSCMRAWRSVRFICVRSICLFCLNCHVTDARLDAGATVWGPHLDCAGWRGCRQLDDIPGSPPGSVQGAGAF